jgi:hypothetical protein
MADRAAAVGQQVDEAFGQAIGGGVVDHRAHERAGSSNGAPTIRRSASAFTSPTTAS